MCPFLCCTVRAINPAVLRRLNRTSLTQAYKLAIRVVDRDRGVHDFGRNCGAGEKMREGDLRESRRDCQVFTTVLSGTLTENSLDPTQVPPVDSMHWARIVGFVGSSKEERALGKSGLEFRDEGGGAGNSLIRKDCETRRFWTPSGLHRPEWGRSRVCKSMNKWSGRRDSNSRPLAPQASALPGCATARTFPVYTPAVPARPRRIPAGAYQFWG